MKKQRFVKIKFQYKLLALFVVVFLVPIVGYGMIVTNNLEATYRTSAREAAYEKMTETENAFSEFRQDLQGIVNEIASDQLLCSLIDKGEEDFEKEIDYINSAELIFTNLSTAIISNESISSVYLYHSSGELHYVNYTDTVDRSHFPGDEEWYRRIAESKQSFFLAPHADQQTVTQENTICSYVAPVIAEGQNGDFAVMKINFSADEFYERIGFSEAKTMGVVLLDENDGIITQKSDRNGQTVSAVEKYLESKKESFSINGMRYMAVPYQLKEIGWTIVSITNENELTSEIANYNAMITLFTVVMAFLLIIFSYMIAALISRPIKGMATMTENIKRGEPGTEHIMPPMPSNFLMKDEYDSFTDTINNLVHQINESNDIRTRQEFEILQAQINPHFIYNTLNTIKWSAHMDGNERTEKAVTALINLFKSTIRVGVTYISVEEELNQLRDYLAVQSYRYDDGFAVEVEIDENCLQYRTLKFMLQPLVENAIFHGLDMSSGTALLKIGVAMQEEKIVYTVTDNGCGMTAEQVDELLSGKKKMTGTAGIGVSNVNARIQKYFGQQYGLRVQSEAGKGTTVTMVIPAIVYQEDCNESIDRG